MQALRQTAAGRATEANEHLASAQEHVAAAGVLERPASPEDVFRIVADMRAENGCR